MRPLLWLLPLIACLSAQAAPMPFYLWQSRLNGHLTCSQTSPGEGWARLSGPFSDAGCRQPLKSGPSTKGLAVPKGL
ncbi:hypothetical protein [Pseudomonas citronellolis]|uniref:hypothetical protein n=1 Tax=Pseudomonas citronellolis TaxID=53408 RepID=UPI0023E3F7E8|nr:hypothetical protein [Pseudomonas citronellolis]MDF3933468.1 hypothetical protein [Pseudomonas citronellolis]